MGNNLSGCLPLKKSNEDEFVVTANPNVIVPLPKWCTPKSHCCHLPNEMWFNILSFLSLSDLSDWNINKRLLLLCSERYIGNCIARSLYGFSQTGGWERWMMSVEAKNDLVNLIYSRHYMFYNWNIYNCLVSKFLSLCAAESTNNGTVGHVTSAAKTKKIDLPTATTGPQQQPSISQIISIISEPYLIRKPRINSANSSNCNTRFYFFTTRNQPNDTSIYTSWIQNNLSNIPAEFPLQMAFTACLTDKQTIVDCVAVLREACFDILTCLLCLGRDQDFILLFEEYFGITSSSSLFNRNNNSNDSNESHNHNSRSGHVFFAQPFTRQPYKCTQEIQSLLNYSVKYNQPIIYKYLLYISCCPTTNIKGRNNAVILSYPAINLEQSLILACYYSRIDILAILFSSEFQTSSQIKPNIGSENNLALRIALKEKRSDVIVFLAGIDGLDVDKWKAEVAQKEEDGKNQTLFSELKIKVKRVNSRSSLLFCPCYDDGQ